MDVRILGIGIIFGLALVGMVHGAYTDYEKTDYITAGHLPMMNEAMDLNTAIANLKTDVLDFGPSSIFKGGDDWADEAEKLRKRNVELRVLISKSTDNKEKADLTAELIKNYPLITKANKLSITKYAEDNTNGKNDQKISQRHFAIAQNAETVLHVNPKLGLSTPSDIYEMRLAALEAATAADEFNVKAWDARIDMLRQLGRNEEADKVKDEMHARAGSTFLEALLPLSPLTTIIGLILACLGLVSVIGRVRRNP